MPEVAALPRSGLGLLLRGLGRHRLRVLGCFACLTTWNLCEALVPVVVGLTIDQAVLTGDPRRLLVWAAVMCLLFTVLSYSYRVGARLGFGANQRITHDLRVDIAAHVLSPLGARTGLLPGETLSLATSDTDRIGMVVRQLGYTVAAAGSVAVSAWVLLRTDLALGLVVLVGVPLVLVLIQVLTPLIARRSTVQQAGIAAAAGTATDLIRGLRPLKGIGGEAEASRRYRVVSQQACKASIDAARSHGHLTAVTTILSGLLLGVVTLLAGRLTVTGELSIGELVAVVGLTQFLAEPISTLGELAAQAAESLASARRVRDFLATPALATAGRARPAAREPGALVLEDIVAGTLDGLSLRLAPGELVGLVVDDPVSADSLVQLLRGERPAESWSGSATLAGVELDDLDIDVRRRMLLVDHHHVDLFEGTLRGNIDLEARLSPEGLEEVLRASAADDVVGLHPDGLDQPTTAAGSTYSGGQRQRVALARALAAQAPVLVLDHPTTAVDTVTEDRIAQGIRRVRHGTVGGLSTLVLTTSPAVLAVADRVLVVAKGRVVASGTHGELVALEAYREAVLR
jgi:putative ABC transport system ATP-binding protein